MGDEDAAPLCDLVLEGGLTSALIYTGVIARLSRHYRFKRLGGTSSGAAAAAAGAIAQRARLVLLKQSADERKDALDPFEDGVRRFPSKLAETDKQGRTALFRLFQAQESTYRGYRIVATWLTHRAEGGGTAAVRALLATIRNFPIAAFVGALPGFWILLTTWWSLWPNGLRNPVNWCNTALGLGLVVFLGLLAAVLWAAWTTLSGMSRNHFGLCSGMKGAERSDDDKMALTPTLHRFFNELFKRNEETDPPVVFGELWGKEGLAGGEREIDLQVITTALNLRRPYRLPNDPGVDPLSAFFYDPKEWEEFFPGVVLTWLEKHRRLADGPRVTNERGGELYALPPPELWPVLVAVRMSLSFPGLLSAVPMYMIEWGRTPGTEREKALVPFKVYFSDGGITSNCPVHLFDAPLPGHPTFAVRLDTFGTGDSGRHRIWLPGDETEPPPRVRPFDARCALAAAWSFVFGIVDTAREWRDGLQRNLPGYRERVVIVGLKPREGGLNLAMTPRKIASLAKLGTKAALRLQRAFVGPRANGQHNAWDRHRWIRLRSTLAAAQSYLEELQKPQPSHDPGYHELLEQVPPIAPHLPDRAAVAQAQALLDGLSALARGDPAWPDRDLGANAPQPAPRLRMSSPW